MPTNNRLAVWQSMEEYQKILQPENKNWDILEIGIDGDEKPSGNYKYFGQGNNWKTMDNLERLNPDIIDDISEPNYLLFDKFDLIICSQVLEHIFNFKQAIINIYNYLKKGGFAIIDCPFEFPYHGLPDYDDYWRISYTALENLLKINSFEVIICRQLNCLTTALAKKI